jgi:restriction system protein
LDDVLTPFTALDIPAVPKLPPLETVGSGDRFAGYKILKEDYFKDPKWIKKAETLIEPANLKNRTLSFEEARSIQNSVIADEFYETQALVESKRICASNILNQARADLRSLQHDLAGIPSVENICRLVELVNKRHFLPPFLRGSFSVGLDPESKTLLIQFEFPDYRNISISYSHLRNGSCKYLSSADKKKAVGKCLYSLMIRSGYLASKFNINKYYENIVVNVEQNWFDPATGQPRNGIIASLQGATEYFIDLDLSKLEPEACFRHLKGLLTPSLDNISPIRPIFVLNKEDKRFIKSKDINSNILPEANLAAIEWEDFEHLVAQLFEWEFCRQGVEVKVTRASRDRGVDAILFDPDPIRGGKYVLQAKRYTRTVDVSAVRDLYGTVLNEGANRGILITTASFGPDSYEFAKDKPISLVDGPNLLIMLQRHGKRFRIDLNEARNLNG